ncbi:DUF2515 family protein [Paenibacillus nasutitermitis]|uniref:DUF2515 domain-containing protein n=1 Tax=Paenibacillus nasutitermitis TaxID=1652958 RepID=A0A916YWY1_9BACL|nr:DUF2515 family protein [Paenibacillus nasutitermitis]GGD64902.1 hypothetical protein GCM10010911_23360 [Paenibacillus nasutitermitis]
MEKENSAERHSFLKRVYQNIMALLKLPAKAMRLAEEKIYARQLSQRLAQTAKLPRLHEESVKELRDAWSELLKAGAAESGKRFTAAHGETNKAERSLIYRIQLETERANRNNVTRTEAYRAIYFRCPELHWALLAHMVSRNGGWSMTDLRGELLSRIIPEKQRQTDYILLERINSLIFSDAFPQLLLYEAGKRSRTNYTHLLHAFGVSSFMVGVWTQFWRRRESALLTTALIVNEQHFIEKRVVEQPFYKEHVLSHIMFQLQSPLQTNAIFMPYGAPGAGQMKLAGLVLEDFSRLEERIEFGKRLYAILFGIPEVFHGVLAFVRAVPHTGSRADYASHLFAFKRTGGRQPKHYTERISGCRLLPGAKPLYSPRLEDAWPDEPFLPVEGEDWMEWAEEIGPYFEDLPLPPIFEITNEHCLGINKMELAVLAAERLKTDKNLE